MKITGIKIPEASEYNDAITNYLPNWRSSYYSDSHGYHAAYFKYDDDDAVLCLDVADDGVYTLADNCTDDAYKGVGIKELKKDLADWYLNVFVPNDERFVYDN